MGSNWNESTPERHSEQLDLPPALNAAVILSQVLSTRVLNGLPVRPTQWNTLESRVTEWRLLLASERSRQEPLTRSHLNILMKIMNAILAQTRSGRRYRSMGRAAAYRPYSKRPPAGLSDEDPQGIAAASKSAGGGQP